jgi:acylphosphatase
MNQPVLHATVHFTGHVQGVGFRYTTLQVAKEFEVAGYVQNLTDGRVLLEVEGQAGVVDEFVTAVAERMHGHVRKIERVQQKRSPAFQGFEIR